MDVLKDDDGKRWKVQPHYQDERRVAKRGFATKFNACALFRLCCMSPLGNNVSWEIAFRLVAAATTSTSKKARFLSMERAAICSVSMRLCRTKTTRLESGERAPSISPISYVHRFGRLTRCFTLSPVKKTTFDTCSVILKRLTGKRKTSQLVFLVYPRKPSPWWKYP